MSLDYCINNLKNTAKLTELCSDVLEWCDTNVGTDLNNGQVEHSVVVTEVDDPTGTEGEDTEQVQPSQTSSSNNFNNSANNQIKFQNQTQITSKGLWFTKYEFGPHITPKGNCIKVYKGYIFLAWFRGGMSDRHVMLSRAKVWNLHENKCWKHICFPHQHVGFKGDRSTGDSHNTISIGICNKNHGIHMLYDMHAYRKSELPNNFFNYSYSNDGAALVSDNEWNINLFHAKQHFLKKGEDYNRVTYPGFFNTSDGTLVVKYRIGGHTDANMYLSFFDGSNWSAPKLWNKFGSKCGIYGGFSMKNDRCHAVFATRSNADQKLGYCQNRGVYYASTDYPQSKNWYNLSSESMTTPIQNVQRMKLFDPTQTPADKFNNPAFAMTQDNSMHFLCPIQRKGQTIVFYYYKKSDESDFKRCRLQTGNLGPVQGNLFSIYNTVFLVSMKNGRAMIQSAPSGTNKFKLLYYKEQGPLFKNFMINTWKDINDKHHMFLIGMVNSHNSGAEDEKPITLLHFLLPDTKGW